MADAMIENYGKYTLNSAESKYKSVHSVHGNQFYK